MDLDAHKTLIQRIFDSASTTYGHKGCSFFDHFGERLVALAQPAEGDQILDIATGTGAILVPAAQRVGPYGHVTGIDLSHKMLSAAATRAPFPWVHLQQMDAEHLLFPDRAFDQLFCGFAIFFFSQIEQALLEFRRVLKRGGRLAISTFYKRTLLDEWVSERIRHYGVLNQLASMCANTPEKLQGLLEQAGFSQIQIYQESTLAIHKDAEAWWDSLWSHGARSRLEQLSPEALVQCKAEALAYAGAGRIEEVRTALLAVAHCEK